MKKLTALIFILSLFSLNLFAQTEEKLAATSNAEVSFEKDMHDFGTIDYAGDGTYAFRFTNTGTDPLIIADAKGSCGCTVPKWPKEPIQKGQSGFINVSYDTKRPGPFTKTVTITCNAKNTPTKVSTIKGIVKTQEQTEDATPFQKNSGLSPFENSGKK